VLKKILAEHTSKSKMKEKMLVRTQNFVSSVNTILQAWHEFISVETMGTVSFQY